MKWTVYKAIILRENGKSHKYEYYFLEVPNGRSDLWCIRKNPDSSSDVYSLIENTTKFECQRAFLKHIKMHKWLKPNDPKLTPLDLNESDRRIRCQKIVNWLIDKNYLHNGLNRPFRTRASDAVVVALPDGTGRALIKFTTNTQEVLAHFDMEVPGKNSRGFFLNPRIVQMSFDPSTEMDVSSEMLMFNSYCNFDIAKQQPKAKVDRFSNGFEATYARMLEEASQKLTEKWTAPYDDDEAEEMGFLAGCQYESAKIWSMGGAIGGGGICGLTVWDDYNVPHVIKKPF